MIILGIETSCDETGAAVLQKQGDRIQILSNIVASSAQLQAKYGGIIPEQAAREQIKSIIPVVKEALVQAFPNYTLYPIPYVSGEARKARYPYTLPIDAIAVTYGPGLIGSLLVGVETAKTLALVWNKPLIPVNHLLGHFYANWIENKYTVESIEYKEKENNPSILDTLYTIPKFPSVGLLVSGGHTDLVLFHNHGQYTYLGGTRDDAAGECFDKCARLLGLPYPGGPQISQLAQKGNPKAFDLPRPMMENGHFSAKGGPAYGWDFSFSGLKTAVSNIVSENSENSESQISSENRNFRQSESPTHRHSNYSGTPSPSESFRADLAASIESAIVEVLVAKTIKAAKMHNVKNIMAAGGVAANKKLATELKLKIENLKLKINLHIPSANLCTDNAAMVAAAGFFQKPITNPLKLQADPSLALTN